MKAKVAVIAGTLVDTAMGVEYLNRKDPEIEAIPYSATSSPREGQLFQLSDTANKRRRFTEIFDEAESQGIKDFFIYCNSLSGVFDFEGFAQERGVRVYTPLQVYRDLGRQFDRSAVMAVNNQSTAGIERSLYENNPNAEVVGMGMLSLICAVEDQRDPDEIVANAAPRTPMPSPKMKMGSRMALITAPITVVIMPILGKPWALMKPFMPVVTMEKAVPSR